MIKDILKSMKINKQITASSIINGKAHTGKIALVKSIYDDSILIDGNYIDKHKSILSNKTKIIIYNFDKIKDMDYIDFNTMQIIAISSYEYIPQSIKNKFAFVYEMPSLKTRKNEIQEFVNKVSKKAKKALHVQTNEVINLDKLDLSQNFQSIEASIYKHIIKQTLSKDEIENILYIYLHSNINDDTSYRKLLGIFERPLIKAGLDKYKSSLKLSKILGINRNTLSKKILTNAIR